MGYDVNKNKHKNFLHRTLNRWHGGQERREGFHFSTHSTVIVVVSRIFVGERKRDDNLTRGGKKSMSISTFFFPLSFFLSATNNNNCVCAVEWDAQHKWIVKGVKTRAVQILNCFRYDVDIVSC